MADHPHHHHGAGEGEKISLVFLLNLIFAIIELIGGVLTNSIAIISDALHDFGDSFVLGVSWIAEKKAQSSGNKQFSFGFARVRLMTALLNSLTLTAGSIFMITRAIPRLFTPEEINTEGVLWLAVLGILVNGFAALRMGVFRKKRLDLRSIGLHMLEDLLGWLLVLIMAVVVKFTEFWLLDPILSLAISSFIIWNALGNLYQTCAVLLQGLPRNVNIQSLEKKLNKQLTPHSLHHFHLWSLDSALHVLSVHVHLKSYLTIQEIITLKQNIRKVLETTEIHHSTIEVEVPNETCGIDERKVTCMRHEDNS